MQTHLNKGVTVLENKSQGGKWHLKKIYRLYKDKCVNRFQRNLLIDQWHFGKVTQMIYFWMTKGSVKRIPPKS